MRVSKYLFLASLAFFMACSPTVVKQKTDASTYSEDLSYLRKDYVAKKTSSTSGLVPDKIEIKQIPDNYQDIEPVDDIGMEIDSAIQVIKKRKSEIDYYKGYTIQIFSGTSRHKAVASRDKVYGILLGQSPSIKYYQPNYQVKVGQYFTQMDAMEDFALLKKSFPSALVIPYKIPIDKIE